MGADIPLQVMSQVQIRISVPLKPFGSFLKLNPDNQTQKRAIEI
jgi:hypothetical protein